MWNKCRIGLALVVGCALLTTGGSAFAGQHKRLSAVATLAAGAQVQTWNSPQNQGAAAEMDTFEYLSSAAGASYRCRLLFNNTGRQITVARVGVNGTISGTCTTAVNGTCDIPFASHAGSLLFQCIVATFNGGPAAPGSFYSFAVQRQPAALQEALHADEAGDSASGSGLKTAQE